MNTEPTLSSVKTDTPKKKKHRRWPWVVVGAMIVLPLGFLGWTGLYNIPIVSGLFGTNRPIDLGVEISPAALTTALRDNPMTFTGDPKEWYGLSQKKYTGTVPIDDRHSSEEVTSFIDHYTQGRRYARDIQVKFHPGGLEVSAFVVPMIKAPIYADLAVTRTSDTTVSITLLEGKIGRLTVPDRYYEAASREITKWINDRLAEVDGLTIESLQYSANEAYLKGTLPATVEQIPGQEYTILGQDLREL